VNYTRILISKKNNGWISPAAVRHWPLRFSKPRRSYVNKNLRGLQDLKGLGSTSRHPLGATWTWRYSLLISEPRNTQAVGHFFRLATTLHRNNQSRQPWTNFPHRVTAVISVSINPGATALSDIFLSQAPKPTDLGKANNASFWSRRNSPVQHFL